MIPATTPLVGFSGEIIFPLGQISLLVKIGDEEHSTSAWINFMVVRSPSPYNGIIGRPGVRRIQAVPSTTHKMLKFLVTGRMITLRSNMIIPLEFTMVLGPGVPQPVINQVTKEKIQVAIHLEYPEQTIAIGSTLIEDGRKELCGLLRRNLDIFSRRPADMARVPQHIAEQRLNIRKGCLPVRQKKRGQEPKRNKVIYEEVEKLVDTGLEKVCPKDAIRLPEIDWKVSEVMYLVECQRTPIYRGSLVLGFPSISLVAISGRSGTLVGQGSITIVSADADYLFSSLSFPHSYLFGDSLRLSRLGFIFLFSTIGSFDNLKSVLTQSALDDLCEKYFIPDVVHPELPSPNSRIHRNILEYFQIHLSQLSVIAAAKVSHFEILCHVYGFVPTVDVSVFPLTVPWNSAKLLRKDPPPAPDEFSTEDRVVLLAGVYDQGGVAAPGVGIGDDDDNEGGGGNAPSMEHTEQSGHVIHFKGIKILADDKAQALVVDNTKNATTARKSLGVLQNMFDKSTLAAEVGATTAATIPLVTSSVASIPEHEGGEYADSVSVANVQTKRPAERFVISSDTHDSNVNAADDEVSLFIWSTVPSSTILNPTAVATTVIRMLQDLLNHPEMISLLRVFIVVDQLAPYVFFLQLRAMEYDQLLNEFNVGAARQTCLNAEVRMLLEHLLRGKKRLEEAEEAARACELGSVKEHSLSCDDLSIKASTLECLKDKLIDQVSSLEATCSELRRKVSGYQLFKERIEEMQDAQMKVLSDRITSMDSDLMVLALHMDEEFYPYFLTTLVGRVLADVAAYDSSAEANYLAVINDLRSVDFSLLFQPKSRKDASIIDIIDHLHLEGSTAETSKGLLLQPSPEQLMVPIHRLEDQVVIGEISLSNSLEVAHSRVQKLKGDATACRLSLTDAIVHVVKPLSVRSLTGEVSSFEVLAVTTTLPTTFSQASIILPRPSSDVPLSPRIVSEQEKQDVAPKHAPLS
ncbi:hypothetical protein Tco_1405856 [Tanacetum coccineum]